MKSIKQFLKFKVAIKLTICPRTGRKTKIGTDDSKKEDTIIRCESENISYKI